MNKKFIKLFSSLFLITFLLSSCYTATHIVGEGAKGNQEISEWNHYVLFGLVPVDLADSKKMVGEVDNYTITTSHSFVNGLLNAVTLGIYAPTTTTVKK
jgi:hypothetical protein